VLGGRADTVCPVSARQSAATVGLLVVSNVVLTCTNGVSSKHLRVIVASDSPWTTLSTRATNRIWSQTESTPRSGWWCSHMAGIYSNFSTREIIIINLGIFSSKTLNFISELGCRICVHTGDVRETSYLLQCISIMLQLFNSMLLHDTLPVDLPDLWPSDMLILAFFSF